MEWHKTVMSLSTNLYVTSVQKIYLTSKNIVEIEENSAILNYDDGFLALKNVPEILGSILECILHWGL